MYRLARSIHCATDVVRVVDDRGLQRAVLDLAVDHRLRVRERRPVRLVAPEQAHLVIGPVAGGVDRLAEHQILAVEPHAVEVVARDRARDQLAQPRRGALVGVEHEQPRLRGRLDARLAPRLGEARGRHLQHARAKLLRQLDGPVVGAHVDDQHLRDPVRARLDAVAQVRGRPIGADHERDREPHAAPPRSAARAIRTSLASMQRSSSAAPPNAALATTSATGHGATAPTPMATPAITAPAARIRAM